MALEGQNRNELQCLSVIDRLIGLVHFLGFIRTGRTWDDMIL